VSILGEFKKFALRGNVVELAVGIVIGAAFTGIVTSFVNDLLMPPIGLLIGKADFTNLFVSLSGRHFESLAAAKAAGAPTLNYGVFINTILNFLIVAFAVFLVVREVNALNARMSGPAPAAATRECPQCAMVISLKAKRCPHCTSEVAH
jgi:large conductance mechanosensitive channel